MKFLSRQRSRPGLSGRMPQHVFRGRNHGIEPLETRIAPALTSPFQLNGVNGTNGLHFSGLGISGFGERPVAVLGDVNGDGFDDVIFGATAINAAFVVFGKADGFPADINLTTLDGTNGFRIDGTATSNTFGQAVSGAGDINGDGFADIIVGAFNETIGANAQAGAAYVIFGRASFGANFSVATLNGTNGFKLAGVAKNDQAGSEVGSAGDFNGDGYDDIVVSALAADPNGSNSGTAYVVFGRPSGFSANLPLAGFSGANGVRINGAAANDFLGGSVSSAGDVNGDGIGDLIVGAQGANANGVDSGAAYVIFGRTNFEDSIEVSALNGANGFRLRGAAAGDSAGFSVAGGGDVNGDGIADVVVGAFAADANGADSGAAYVIFGKSAPFAANITLSALNGTDGFRILGEDANALTGYSVHVAGDVNGDGFDDVIIGAPGEFNRTSNAATYVVYGRPTFAAGISLAGLNGTDGVKLLRTQANDKSGSNVSGGDINGDGLEDIIGSDDFGGFVVFGSPAPAVTQVGTTAGNTLTGDENVDVVIGGAGGDTILGNGGGDVLRGGQGDDVLAITGADFRQLAGGLGSDTLRLDGGGFGLDLTAFGASRISGFERIDLTAGGNFLTLNYREVQNISQTTNTLTIVGGADDFVDFGGGWLDGGTEVIGGDTFHVFLQGTARLNITEGTGTSRPAGLAVERLDGSRGYSIVGETDFDAIGRTVSTLGDVNGDGFDDFIIGAYRANPLGVGTGATYVVFGKAGGLPATLDLATLDGTNGFRMRGTNQPSNAFSIELGSAGDVNGDGFADILVSEVALNTPAQAAGAVYVVLGRPAFAADLLVTALNGSNGGFRVTGVTAFENVGAGVAAGDVNGDGFDDIIIGAPRNDAVAKDAGAVFVLFGKSSGFANLSVTQIDGTNGFRVGGEKANDYFGSSVAAGDVNGDGLSDIIAGALGSKAGGTSSGGAYVIFGKTSGFGAGINVSMLNGGNGFELRSAAGDSAGLSVSSAGDINGDGFDDVVVGAFGASLSGRNTGASYVVFGKAGVFSADLSLSTLNGTNGFRINGSGFFNLLGYSVSSAGDFNGDGFDDLVVTGTERNLQTDIGAQQSYVIFGHAGGFSASFAITEIDGFNGVKLGTLNGAGGSPSASGAADINGDGFDDIMMGSWFGDGLGRIQAGKVFVVFGADSGAVTQTGDAGENTLTGSEFPDVLVAGQANDVLLGKGGIDAMRGGQGDDVFTVSDLTFLRLNGGTGTDTLRLDGAGIILNLSTIADTKLSGFERIDLTGSGANTLTLNAREVVNLSPTSNTLTVLGDAGDFVNIGAGWIREANQTEDLTTFEVFTSGAATLRIGAGVGHSLPSGYVLAITGNELPGMTIDGVAVDDAARFVGSAGDVNADGFDDMLVSAPTADPNGVNSGAAYVIFGKAGGFPSSLELSTLNGANGFTVHGESAADFLSFSIGAAGDFNGDGFGDLILSSLHTGGASNQSGTAYLVYGHGGPFASTLELSALDGTNGIKLRATAFSSIGGLTVASAGDVNGDGFDDVVIGAGNITTGALTQKGAAYVVFGHTAVPGATLDLATLNGTNGFAIAGTAKFEATGTSVSGGDVNGDGFSDVIIGTRAGRTYIVFGKAAGFAPSLAVSALNGLNGFTIAGGPLIGSAGQSVSAAGDVNGDGLGDLLIGAPSTPGIGGITGAAFVVFGKAGNTFGSIVNLPTLNGANGFRINGRDAGESGEYAGESVSAAGDVNGDGFDDVIVGAAFTDSRGLQSGEAYVIYGHAAPFAPVFDVAALDGGTGFSLIGSLPGARAGRSVSGVGDVNGDGFDDILVGSYGVLSGSSAPGRSYLVLGFDSGKVTQQGDANANALNGTAGTDVIVGGQGNDTLSGVGAGDVLRGGQGDDIFSVGSGPLKRLVGGHGFDTIVLNGGLLIDLTARPLYRINGFEQLDLRNGINYLSLDARAVLNASPDTNTLIVRADVDDIVNIGVGWTVTGSEVIDGDTFAVMTQGAATLKVSTAIAPVVTLVDAHTATYTDVDGDLVTIKVTKGTIGVSDFLLFPAGTVGGAQLAVVNFADDGAEFQDSDITITAKRTSIGGDGSVNVGRIEALGVDLGKVTVSGDLRVINAGDANFSTPGLDLLSIGSMGRFGQSTQGPGGVGFSVIQGQLGSLRIASDLIDAPISTFVGAGNVGIGSVNIAGSLIGEAAASTGIFSDGAAGAIVIGQDIRGGIATGAGSIFIQGNIASLTVGGSIAGGSGDRAGDVFSQGTLGAVKIGGDLQSSIVAARNGIASVAVGGSVQKALILAGYNSLAMPENADATIGAVTVAGDWIASSLVAGVSSSDPYYANGGDVLITSSSPAVSGGDPTKIAKITSVVIKGEVLGTPGGSDAYGFIAEEIGAFTVGGTRIPLQAGKSNDLSGLPVGSTLDVKVREVKLLGIFETPPAVESPAGGPAFSLTAIDGVNGFRFDGAAAGAGAGRSVSSAGDVNGDGFDDIIIGAAGATVAGQMNTGEAYVIFGTSSGLPASMDPADLNGRNGFRIQADFGNKNSYFALGVGGAGDVNNDGFDDVIVGGIADGGGFTGTTEKAYVIFGKASAFAPVIKANSLNGTAGFEITHPVAPDPNLGTFIRMSVGGVGDLNGDHFDDVAIGAVNADFAAQNAGAAYVVFSPGATVPASINVDALNGTNGFRLDGPNSFANLGYSLSRAGDVNGDGFDDFIVGSPRAIVGGAASGSGYVVYGKGTPFAASFGVGTLNGANGFRIPAIDFRADTGELVSGGGDINGDGIDDIVIGAPYAGPNFTYPGASYVIFGKKTSVTGNFPADFPLGALNGANGFKITGESEYDYAGRAVIAGDINGDGLADIAIGAIGLEAKREYRGGAYVVFGNAAPAANIGLGSLDGLNGVKILGVQPGDETGLGISGAGDFNNDGRADLLIGAVSAAMHGSSSGSAFVVSGASLVSGVKILPGGKSASFTDVDGDRVVITTNRGAFEPADFTTRLFGQVGGLQLQSLNLGGPSHAAFAGANITITATRSLLGGDGFVNVGYLNSTGNDLGSVTIDGDLGQIDVGNGDPLKQAIASLTVQSLGRLGLSTQVAGVASLESNIAGKLGKMLVKSDVDGAFVKIDGSTDDGDDDTGAITIGGSVRGGLLANSGSIFAAGDIGVVKIGQSLIGSFGAHGGSIEAGGKITSITLGDSLLGGSGVAGGSIISGSVLGAVKIGGDISGGRIFARGNLTPASNALALAIKSLAIGGNVSRASLFAGYDRNGNPINADVQIGAVTVGRDWIASDLVAGVKADNGFFGDGDSPIPAGNAIVSRIASITIKGQALGSVSAGDHFGFVAGEIGSLNIRGTALPLTSAGGQAFAVGATGDLRVVEVS